MNYESLQKLFYKSPERYDTLYRERFESEYAVHLDFEIHGFQAFYLRIPEVFDLLLRIHKKDKDVRAVRQALPIIAQKQFAKRCLIDEVVLTNSIEGVNSTRRDISEVLESLKVQDKKKRFSGLVNKYLMLQENDSLNIQTCEDIRSIYDELVLKEVAEEDAGDIPDGKIFRKGSVSVYSSSQKIIHVGIFPEDKIIEATQKALAFLSDGEKEMLERIAVFHYLLGYIHPFYNGNGRLSRFISSYLLSRELDQLTGYRLSYTIKERIKSYYEAFVICNDERNRGDLTPFLICFLEIVYEAVDQLYVALYKRYQSLETFSNLSQKVPFIADNSDFERLAFLLIQAELFSEYGITTQELMDITGVSRITINKRLKKFENFQLLIRSRLGHKYTFRLDLNKLREITM